MSASSEELFSAFRRTTGQIRRDLYEVRAGVGGADFERGQGRLMRLLLSRGGVTQTELAREMGIRPASLSELLKKLEQKGLVLREKNGQDRRVVNLRLTPEGETQAEMLEAAKAAYANRLFSALDESESLVLAVLLRKLDAQLASGVAQAPAPAAPTEMAPE